MAKSKSDSHDDLSSLIHDAYQTETARRRDISSPVKRANHVRVALLAVLFAALAYLGHGVWRYEAPPSKAQVSHDLEHIIDMTRQSIDEARESSGELPRAIPNASLAAVVQYIPESGKYQLSATLLGVRVTLSQDGSKSTDMVP